MEKLTRSIQIEIDPEVEAVYIRLGGNHVKKTEQLDADVRVGLDSTGKPVGLEFLDMSKIAAGLRRVRRQCNLPSLRRIRPVALQSHLSK